MGHRSEVLQQQKIRDGTSFVIKLGDKNVPALASASVSMATNDRGVTTCVNDRGPKAHAVEVVHPSQRA